MSNIKSFTIQELARLDDIDSWVYAMANMADVAGVMREACSMADIDATADEMAEICPAELESQFYEIADRDCFRFNADGDIVSFDRTSNK